MENNFKKNAIWNTLGVTFNAFNSLFFLVIINRINGIDDGGIFSIGFSLACLFFVVGIYAGRTYQVSDTKGILNDSEYFVHKILTCSLMLIVAVVYILFQDYSFDKSIIVLTLVVYKCLEAFSDTLYGYMQKKDFLYLVGISQFMKSLISIVVFLIVDLCTRSLLLSCLSLIVVNILVIILFDFIKIKGLVCKEPVRSENILKLFKLGFSIFAFSFLAIYIVNVPKYTIDGLLESSFQTIFNIIVMPGTVISLCGQYIMGPSLTGVVDDYNNMRYNDFRIKINKIIKIILLLGALIIVVAYFLGIPVLSIVYAIDLADYRIDLVLIILGALFYAIANIYSTALITMRKNNMQLVVFIISSIVGFIISNLLIREFGVHGASYAYFGTMIVHGLMYIIYFNYEYKKLNKKVSDIQ